MDIQSTIKATVEQVVSKYVTKPPTTHNGSVETVVGNTANVLLDGGAEPTPCSMRVSCMPGERVSVTIEHHRAYVTGNLSAPPTDDTTAIIAQGAALDAMESAELAADAASDAQASAVVANTAANNALYGLGTVQDVVNALGEDVDDLQTHVALTDEGLFVVVNDEGYRLKLANDGAYIIDGSGDVVTTLSESITLSSSRPQYIGGDDAYIVFYDTDDDDVPDTIRIGGNVIMGGSKTLAEVLEELEGTLIYDHTYSISNGVATFAPHVYQGGAEVTTDYAATCFGWYYRLIDGSEATLTTKSDRGCDVTITSMGYGGHVIGTFTPPE